LLAEETLNEEQLSNVQMIRNSDGICWRWLTIFWIIRTRSGQEIITTGECRIGDLVGEVESMLRPQAIEKNIAFDCWNAIFCRR
jgi:hypothetical protein